MWTIYSGSDLTHSPHVLPRYCLRQACSFWTLPWSRCQQWKPGLMQKTLPWYECWLISDKRIGAFISKWPNDIVDSTMPFGQCREWNDHTLGASGHCIEEDMMKNHNQKAHVELYSCSGAAWQKWDLVGGTIVNRQSGRCLDIQWVCAWLIKIEHIWIYPHSCKYELSSRCLDLQ